MPTYSPNPTPTEIVRVSSGVGAYTINLNNGDLGQKIVIVSKDANSVPITLNAAAGEFLRFIDGTQVTSVTLTMVQEGFTIEFDPTNLEWFVTSFYEDPLIEFYEQATTPVDISSATDVIIPLQVSPTFPAFTDLITVEANGTLTANHSLIGSVHQLSASVYGQFTMGQNTDSTVFVEWQKTTGTGGFRETPSVLPFQTSRSGVFVFSLATRALWSMDTGDNIRLIGRQFDGSQDIDVLETMVDLQVR